MERWPDLSERSDARELIDDIAALDGGEVQRMHRELSIINRWLGGVSNSLHALDALVGDGGAFSVADIGAGGGDVPRALVERARAQRRAVRVYALDLSARACEELAERTEAYPEIEPVVADGCRLPLPDDSVDVAHAALLFHHLRTDDGVRMLREMRRVARRGVVVNDLHRHRVAWASIRALTRAFSRSRLVRHDAPVSVCRGFRRDELQALGRAADVPLHVCWRWAFRWVATHHA